MEGIQKAFRSAMSQAGPNGSFSSISSALEKAPITSSASVSSADHSQLLLTRSSRSRSKNTKNLALDFCIVNHRS
ncbi:hypothetical protein KY285_030711 [Solanum tuberosum]|nr:hypothetical protein KY284_030528 [Solanum tuberosum]KAH0655829.1 hypothetical protein KY285_030711 [Solanum tuberosum]